MSRLVLDPTDHVIGTPDATSVQLVLYGDYQCPYTRRGIVRASGLMEQLGDGLLYVFRNFPLQHVHAEAMDAACAAEAADRQGRFWDMHLLLFRNQEELDEDSLLGYAAELGLDVEQFNRDFVGSDVRARVRRDLASGTARDVSSTPTFFVDGARYDGDVEGITALVESAATANAR